MIVVTTGSGTITRTLVDVSHSREAGTIIRRLGSRFGGSGEGADFPPGSLDFTRTVVDIGANDGFLSSNSFNLAQLGWSTVLIEPNPEQMELAKRNQEPYIDAYGEGRQNSCYLQAAVSPDDEDGEATLFLTSDAASMESHLSKLQTKGQRKRAEKLRGGKATGEGKREIKVDTVSVGTVAGRCNLSKRFGVLSVDVEGVGDTVLSKWLEGGYRPEYVIYEPMHNKGGRRKKTEEELRDAGYERMGKMGWNEVYEYRDKGEGNV